MSSKISIKNLQDTELNIEHEDGEGALSVTTDDLRKMKGSLSVDNMLHIQDQKTSGTDGGTFTQGAWQTRDLNTILTDTLAGGGVITLNANVIEDVPIGDYYFEAIAPGYSVSDHQARLRDITGSNTPLIGGSSHARQSNAVQNNSIISGIFSITAVSNLELQHQCGDTFASQGFGRASGTSFTVEHELYSDIKIWKVG